MSKALIFMTLFFRLWQRLNFLSLILSFYKVHVCNECLASAFRSHLLNAYANWTDYKAQPLLVLAKKW